ncbi:Hypothetical predicted protein, partial [Marmota monax]
YGFRHKQKLAACLGGDVERDGYLGNKAQPAYLPLIIPERHGKGSVHRHRAERRTIPSGPRVSLTTRSLYLPAVQ